jgi:YidC/Oxa1 family membrane protein insertase
MRALIHTILYQPLYNLLIFFAWLIPGHSIGWAIILLTLVIRLILLPTSLKAAHAQARISALQPKINQIRKKYKDQMEQSKALIALYKEEGVSQFGPCLPLLIQLPILIILYQVFRGGLNADSLKDIYAFVPHLETINTSFYGLNLAKPDLWVLPILAGISQFILSKMTLLKVDSKTDPPDPAQMMSRQMLYIFPIINVFFARIVPSALSLYWVLTSVISIFQQWYVNKKIRKDIPTQAVIEEYMAEQVSDAKLARTPKGTLGVGSRDVSKEIIKEKPSKRDFVARVMDKRLRKQEKKTGVSITIRKKGE